MQREKAAYLILRRKGLSFNLIAEAFGRSVSVVHHAIVKVERYGYNFSVGRRIDLRKLPYKLRMRLAAVKRVRIFQLLSKWESWILGEEGEPP